jgi:DNA topoisomerase-1
VATRLVVNRERERMAFRVASYWDIEGRFDAGAKHDERMFPAKLHSVDGARVARGSDCTAQGLLKDGAQVVHPTVAPRRSSRASTTLPFEIRSVESKQYRCSPYAPFRTTTLQQEACPATERRGLRRRAAAARERLITYMYRLDHLSESAIARPANSAAACSSEYLPTSRAPTSRR